MSYVHKHMAVVEAASFAMLHAKQLTKQPLLIIVPSSMVGEEGLLVIDLVPINYYSVTTRSQLLVFVEYIEAGL